MESYSVEAVLKATDSSFGSTIKAAQGQLEEFGNKTANLGSVIGAGMVSVGSTLTKAVTVPLAGIGIAALKVGSDFESQMSRVKSISGATGDSFDALKQQAIDLGAKTAFSAKESAQGMENLASAGFSANEIMEAMPGLLDLAAVSGGDVGLASENAATALRGFGLEANQAGHVADVFARAAADTNAEVADMGEAMKYVAPVANSMGLSLEETAAAIGIMSDAGIKGSQAGTTLRGALSRLARPTDAMTSLMKSLGISFYDSEGKMKPLKEQISILKKSFEGLTDEQKQNALVTLYGQESLSGMMALIDKGPDALGKLTDGLKNSDGAADEMARTMQDNLSSAVEQMFGSFESIAIVVQEILAPALKQVAEYITSLAEKFVSADRDTQIFIMTIVGIVAAIGPVLIILGKLIGFLGKLKGYLLIIKGTLSALGTVIAGISAPVLIVVGVIAALTAAIVYLWKTNEDFRKKVIEIWQAIVNFMRPIIEEIANFIKNIWGSLISWWNENQALFKATAETIWNAIKTVITAVMAVLAPFIKVAWENIKIVVSAVWDYIKIHIETTLTVILGIVKTVMQLINGDWSGAWETIKSVASAVWEAIKATVTIFLTALQEVFSNSLELLKMIIKTILTAIQEVFLAVWTAIKETAITIFNSLNEKFTEIWTLITETLTVLWTAIKDKAMEIWQAIVDTIQQILEPYMETLTEMWTTLTETLSNIWNGIKDIAQGVWEMIKAVIMGPILVLIDLITLDFKALKGDLSLIWDSIKTAASLIWNGIKTVIQTVVQFIFDFSKNLFNLLKQVVSNIWDSIKNAVSNAVEGTKNAVTTAWEAVRNITSNIMSSVSSSLSNTWESIKSTVSNLADSAADGIRNAWDSALESTRDIFSNIKDAIMAIGDIDLWAAGQAIMDSFLEGLYSMWDSITSFVGDIAGWIRDNKGPISYDRRLLIPAGQAIMKGLQGGIETGFKGVKRTIGNITDDISKTSFDVSPSLANLDNQMRRMNNMNIKNSNELLMNESKKPTYLNLNLGGRNFEGFVDDISNVQDKKIKLESTYSF